MLKLYLKWGVNYALPLQFFLGCDSYRNGKIWSPVEVFEGTFPTRNFAKCGPLCLCHCGCFV